METTIVEHASECLPDLASMVGPNGALLFDCDGTLSALIERAHKECIKQTVHTVCMENRIPFDFDQFEVLWTQHLGRGILNFLTHFKLSLGPAYNLNFPDPEIVEALYERNYIGNFAPATANAHFFRVRRGLISVFKAAVHSGTPAICVSNATQRVLEATLGALGLRQYFNLIIGIDTVLKHGYQPKPHGGSYLCGIHLLQEQLEREISLTDSIGYEDTLGGITSLWRAGIGKIVMFDNDTEGQLRAAWEQARAQLIVAGEAGNDPQFNPHIITLFEHHDVAEAMLAAWSPEKLAMRR